MSRNKIACCFFPSTIMLVDDSERFLNSITFDLDNTVPYKLYQKPYKALQFLKEEYSTSLSFDKWLSVDENDPKSVAANQQTMHVDIKTVIDEVHKRTRFNEISVVVVDYAMPSINGLDFCAQISDLPIKKILLTGEADHQIAAQAFNEGLIDKFIRKDEFNFANNFNEIIHELQHQYFTELSNTLINNLIASKHCCLNNPDFIKLFNRYREENNLIEYYLLDKTGSFLLLDAGAVPYWIIVKTKEELEAMSAFAEKNDASEYVKNTLQEREGFPFFAGKTDYQNAPINEWENYLFPCMPLNPNHDNYYVSLISVMLQHEINQKSILSFGQFIK